MYAVNVKPCARRLIQFLVDPSSCMQLSFAREHNTYDHGHDHMIIVMIIVKGSYGHSHDHSHRII